MGEKNKVALGRIVEWLFPLILGGGSIVGIIKMTIMMFSSYSRDMVLFAGTYAMICVVNIYAIILILNMKKPGVYIFFICNLLGYIIWINLQGDITETQIIATFFFIIIWTRIIFKKTNGVSLWNEMTKGFIFPHWKTVSIACEAAVLILIIIMLIEANQLYWG